MTWQAASSALPGTSDFTATYSCNSPPSRANADSQIPAAIESGDRKLAERIVHTVKGVAGNIGLGQVFTAAEKLERAIREVDADVPALVEEFAQVLSRQVRAIQQAMHDVMPEWPAKEREPGFDARKRRQRQSHT